MYFLLIKSITYVNLSVLKLIEIAVNLTYPQKNFRQRRPASGGRGFAPDPASALTLSQNLMGLCPIKLWAISAPATNRISKVDF